MEVRGKGPGMARVLIQELIADPAAFSNRGRTHQLLQVYFDGMAVATLQPLLESKDCLVRREAIWILSELGSEAAELIESAVLLLDDADRHTQWYALEVVAVCSTENKASSFVHVLQCLDKEDDAIRRLAMRLTGNASQAQLEAAARYCRNHGAAGGEHEAGILALLSRERLSPKRCAEMLTAESAVIRRYGAIALKSLCDAHPELLNLALSSRDPDVSSFCQYLKGEMDSE